MSNEFNIKNIAKLASINLSEEEQEAYEEEAFSDSDQLEAVQDGEISAKEERKR